MKRFLTIAAALLTLSLAAYAQDARQRTVDTIVADVLAQMPCRNAEDFATEMKSLADSAPESVTVLCSMLAPAQDRTNAKIEYALDGLADYVCAPASGEKRAAVREGLVKALSNASEDIYNVQFLVSLLREISPEDVSAPECCQCCKDPDKKAAKAAELAASSASNDRCHSLWMLPEEGLTGKLVGALSDADKAYRATALNVAASKQPEGFNAALAKAFKKLGEGAKADVMNYVGEHSVAELEPLVLKTLAGKGDAVAPAITAASLLGSDKCADALVGLLGKNELASQALSCFNGDVRSKISSALKSAKGDKLAELLKLAGARRIKDAAPKVYSCLASSDTNVAQAALGALKGVVGPEDIDKVSTLLAAAPEDKVAGYKAALSEAIKTLSPAQQYEKVSALVSKAADPARLYDALAQSNTDEAVKDLAALCDKGDAAAVNAMKKMSNYKAAPQLLKIGASDESVLQKYYDLVNTNESRVDRKGDKFIEALKLAKSEKVRKAMLKGLSNAPTMKTFLEAGKYLDDSKLGYTAAGAVKTIATKTTDEIDVKDYVNILTKARDIFAATGDADDSYEVNELNNRLAEAGKKNAVETNALTPEEVSEGFELLFDGVSLDKWTGDKDGYTPVNGTIYVTASYGNSRNLYTVKEYKDFVYRFDFCFVNPGVNNGVGIRTPMGVDAAYDGMCEVQILDHDDPIYKNLHEYQVHGSVYGVVPAKRIVHKPLGEWSTEEIVVKGDRIKVTVNGEVIVDCNVREACQGHNVAPDGSAKNPYTVDHKNHPGMFNEKGHVGFLGHGAGVKFRNVRIKEL